MHASCLLQHEMLQNGNVYYNETKTYKTTNSKSNHDRTPNHKSVYHQESLDKLKTQPT